MSTRENYLCSQCRETHDAATGPSEPKNTEGDEREVDAFFEMKNHLRPLIQARFTMNIGFEMGSDAELDFFSVWHIASEAMRLYLKEGGKVNE
jgi:hypothetical protein